MSDLVNKGFGTQGQIAKMIIKKVSSTFPTL